MSRSERVLKLSKKIIKELTPFCKRIKIVGSIRRKNPNPKDIDIVLIAKNENYKQRIKEKLSKKGKFLSGGLSEMFFRIEGIKVQLFFTTLNEWGAALIAYSGRKGSNIGLRIIARKKRMKLTNHGLFRKGKRIAGKTEREIYTALERQYKEPWER